MLAVRRKKERHAHILILPQPGWRPARRIQLLDDVDLLLLAELLHHIRYGFSRLYQP